MKNGYFTAVRFAVFTLSGVFFIPFLYKQYGSGTYGLIALAGFLTQYVGFISGCIGSSIGRFLNVALNRNDWKEANEIFSTAIIATLIMILLQVPLFALGIWKLDWLFGFPPELGTDFRILVGCNVAAFLISMILGVVSTPIQAANRLDISLSLDVIGEILRLILLIVLILQIGPKLWIIGAVQLVISIAGAGATYYFYRRLARRLIFRRKYITRKWIRPVTNMAGWSIVAGLGQILFQKTDVWIVNRFVDINLAGVCAALLIWPNYVQQIAKNVSSLLMPVVMIDYSQGRFQRIRDLVLLLTKLLSLMSLFICGGLMAFGGWMLELWMGEGYRQYQWLLVLMLLHFPLTLGREAVWLVFPAFNKMKYLGISNLVSGILNIGLSLLLVFMGFGLPGVIIATGASLILQRTLFLSYFATKLLKIKYRKFLGIYTGGLVLIAVVAVQRIVFGSDDFLVAGVVCMVMAVASLVRMYFFDFRFKGLINAVVKNRVRLGNLFGSAVPASLPGADTVFPLFAPDAKVAAHQNCALNVYVSPNDSLDSCPDSLLGDMSALMKGESEEQFLYYLALKDSFKGMRVCSTYPEEGVFLIHKGYVDRFVWNPNLFVVSLQWDFPRDDRAQMHLVSNRYKTTSRSLGLLDRISLPGLQLYVPPVMHPTVIPRNPERGAQFENIAFIGDPKNLDAALNTQSFRDAVHRLGMKFLIIADPADMPDYSNIDVVVAIRKFGRVINNKPAVKLINSWRGGVPSIMGCEVGYREERQSEYDYIEVDSVEEVLEALRKLKDDPAYRAQMVANAARRAQPYTIQGQQDLWVRFFEDEVIPAYAVWQRKSMLSKRMFLLVRWIRYNIRSVQSFIRRRILRFDAVHYR